jgi:hypothetical protein
MMVVIAGSLLPQPNNESNEKEWEGAKKKVQLQSKQRSTITSLTQHSNLTSLCSPFIYSENCHSHISLMSPAGVVGDLPQVVSRKYRARYLLARGRGFES